MNPFLRQPGDEPPNKGKKYPAEPLTEVEVNSLLKQCSNRGSSGIRNKALIMVMYRVLFIQVPENHPERWPFY